VCLREAEGAGGSYVDLLAAGDFDIQRKGAVGKVEYRVGAGWTRIRGDRRDWAVR